MEKNKYNSYRGSILPPCVPPCEGGKERGLWLRLRCAGILSSFLLFFILTLLLSYITHCERGNVCPSDK